MGQADIGGVSSRYRFEGVPLTPKLMASLARSVLDEPVFRRRALEKVQEYHLARGGAPAKTAFTLLVRKAVIFLARAQLIEPAGVHGWWRWRERPGVPASLKPAFAPGTEPAGELEVASVDVAGEETNEGEGSGCVYVYYFPSYKELAGLRKEARWPVKVGMTSARDSRVRVANQQGTAMPEAPVVAYAWLTDTPRKLEQTLHAILSLRGLQLADAPGAEWFLSSPNEVKAIVDWLLGPGPRR
ncbi:GIY-YIG nuclease family protein [Arthrobacter sp. I2-34]|uniref:GIY-YIG nuclease family protein n=1 Tax=Arthrobacter hankyongi TaxID=2904801 RepID=A0ABS9L948_9MICC|nr:GIY-YIG nuclease family protein [Arthrobacter hankyongi]MCG2623002.1 GIY-YIG nuclease family protein [Arthrobacter hankyongi]